MMVAALVRALPPIAVAAFGVGVAVIVAVAGTTLGYDYQAYVNAGQRLLDGQRLYDPVVTVAGGFAIFLYPPPFALAMVPLAVLPAAAGLWLWIGGLLAAFLLGVRLLPVRPSVRWWLILLAGLSWPFLYSVKLGQVGPLLFLAFAAAWWALNRPGVLGMSAAAGVLIKLQPVLLFGFLLASGRRRGAGTGIVAVALAAAVTTVIVGLDAWFDYVDLIRRVSTPVTTPHNFTPGAIVFQMGGAESLANAVQLLAVVVAVAVTAWAWFRADGESALVVTVVASQLLSPLLWDHYAMLLLLPTALLLQRRHWWAIAIPLAGWLPGHVIPVLFLIGLVAPLVTRPGNAAVPAPEAAG